MAGGTDEVEASVDTEVNLFGSAWLLLLKHIGFMLIIEELNDGLPRVTIVHIVAKSRGIDDGEADWTGLGMRYV